MLSIAESYIKFFEDFHAELEQTLDALPPAALDWSPGTEMNSIAVLTVHVLGSERFWLGDVVLGSPSNRDRPAEFRASGVDVAMLETRLADATTYVRSVLEQLTAEDLGSMRMHPGNNKELSVAWCLLHALEHTAMHVGHIQLTRQLWEQQNS